MVYLMVNRIAAWTACIALLLAVFALYTRPEFLRVLADQVWSCF